MRFLVPAYGRGPRAAASTRWRGPGPTRRPGRGRLGPAGRVVLVPRLAADHPEPCSIRSWGGHPGARSPARSRGPRPGRPGQPGRRRPGDHAACASWPGRASPCSSPTTFRSAPLAGCRMQAGRLPFAAVARPRPGPGAPRGTRAPGAHEIWVLRPDAHVAAVVTSPAASPPRSPACSATQDPRGCAMAHYRSVGNVPPKRHTQHRARRRPLLRGADGRGGLLLGLVAALPPAHPVGDRDAPRRGSCPTRRRRRTIRCAAAPARCTSCSRRRVEAHDAVTGRRLVLGNDDVRISYVVAGETSPLYRNAIGDECVYVESRRGDRRDGLRRRSTVGAGRLRRHPAGHDPPVGAGRRRAAAALRRSRPTATSPRRSATCPGTGSSSSTRRTASATCAAPTEPLLVDGEDVEVLRQAPRHRRRRHRRHPSTCCPHHPFDVVGWDGCLYPYALQRRRLRADHRPGPPAAAGAPGLRGPATSWSATSCRARSTTTRCRCRCPTTTPTWTPTR